jgi:hypothetical protein
MTGYPSGKSLIDRSRHLWDCYIGWGSAHPLKRRAMRQLAVSDRITEEKAYSQFAQASQDHHSGEFKVSS